MSLMLLLLSLLAAVVLPALAQDDWHVLLFDSSSKSFLRVNADGTQETYTLDLPQEVFVGAREMAFSPDGSQVAFCTIEYGENGNSTTTLHVRNLETGGEIASVDLGSSIGCRTVGNEDSSLLAVALIRYYSADPQADTSQSAWEVLVIDSATGETLHTLNADSPASSALEYRYGESFLPYVFRVSDEEVVFGEVPYGTEFPPDFPTYTWNFGTDTIEPTSISGLVYSDYMPSTGELAWLEADESLPSGDPIGPMSRNNVVNVTDSSGETIMVYHSPDWLLSSVQFFEGGERLMLQLFEPFDADAPDQVFETRWLALDRQGNTTDLFSSESFASLTPAPGGFLAFYTTSQTLPATYQLEYHGEGGVETLLTFESDVYGGWEIAYVTPSTPATDLPPFTAVSP
jgi:hypothetical protein